VRMPTRRRRESDSAPTHDRTCRIPNARLVVGMVATMWLVSVEQWWPLLQPSARAWLIANIGDAVADPTIAKIMEAGARSLRTHSALVRTGRPVCTSQMRLSTEPKRSSNGETYRSSVRFAASTASRDGARGNRTRNFRSCRVARASSALRQLRIAPSGGLSQVAEEFQRRGFDVTQLPVPPAVVQARWRAPTRTPGLPCSAGWRVRLSTCLVGRRGGRPRVAGGRAGEVHTKERLQQHPASICLSGLWRRAIACPPIIAWPRRWRGRIRRRAVSDRTGSRSVARSMPGAMPTSSPPRRWPSGRVPATSTAPTRRWSCGVAVDWPAAAAGDQVCRGAHRRAFRHRDRSGGVRGRLAAAQ